MTETILRMTGICKSFPGVLALKDVDFDLATGEVHALLGENGAGKSTLIKVLGGIHPADAGTIVIGGETLRIRSVHDAQRAGISIIHQELFMVPELTVAQNMFLGREPMSERLPMVLDPGRALTSAQALLDSIDMEIDAGTQVGDLSIAQQQMVEIAKAISFDSRILVMDEPTSSLTSKETDALYLLIERLRERMAIVYISHRMEELFRISNRVTVLRDGRTIGTRETARTTSDELIEMMVGRKLEELFTKTPTEPGDVVLEARNLCRGAKLDDVSFSVRKGEILGVAGIVGAGRTELMRCLCGIDGLDSGEILVHGKPVAIKKPIDAIHQGIAMVPESRKGEGLVLCNTVGFNLTLEALGDFIHGVRFDRQGEGRIIANAIQKLSIKASSPDVLIEKLSGGNQQKVVIAKWLAARPSVLILDEPTRGVDVGAKAEIYAIIDALAHTGVAIIMVSSELPEIINMSDRVMVMFHGRKTAELPRTELTQKLIMKYATGDSQ
jgi:ribose transport system ATP-binding protein/inositol transport system ATP-binding protein